MTALRTSAPIAATYYSAPSQHLPLDNATATARQSSEGVEVWTASQAPGLARAAAAKAAGVAVDEVTLYPMPAGSPSGSAFECPAIPIAIALARSLKRPVQVTLSHRSAQNYLALAPGAMARMSAVADAGGIPAAWAMRVATADGMGGRSHA